MEKETIRQSTIWIKVDPRTHREFQAACVLRGTTMQESISRHMRDTIIKSSDLFVNASSA